jgi:hypothetical protein
MPNIEQDFMPNNSQSDSEIVTFGICFARFFGRKKEL